jgi:hypothetical protein
MGDTLPFLLGAAWLIVLFMVSFMNWCYLTTEGVLASDLG